MSARAFCLLARLRAGFLHARNSSFVLGIGPIALGLPVACIRRAAEWLGDRTWPLTFAPPPGFLWKRRLKRGPNAVEWRQTARAYDAPASACFIFLGRPGETDRSGRFHRSGRAVRRR